MRAYHGNPAIKEFFLRRVRQHRAAEELLQKYGYWDGGKGCAVGCTIHGEDHSIYERALGIPTEIAHMEDIIFEHLPPAAAQEWPARFLEVIPVGADLRLVISRLMLWLLDDGGFGIAQYAGDEGQAVIARVGDLYRRHLDGGTPHEAAARAAAWAAAEAAAKAAAKAAAWAAARAAVEAAAWAAARAAARAAVEAAAWAAVEAAAWAANAAVEAAAWAANAAARAAAWAAAEAAAEDAWAAAEAAAWAAIADRLIDLLATAPVEGQERAVVSP